MILIDTCDSCRHLCIIEDNPACSTITREFAWVHTYMKKIGIEDDYAVIIDNSKTFGCIFYERKLKNGIQSN